MLQQLTPNYTLLGDAYAIIGGIPDEKFNLNTITMRKPKATLGCGTIGCAMGWLGLHPDFKRKLNMTGPSGEHRWKVNGKEVRYYAEAAAELFSITVKEATNLFGYAGGSNYDNAIRRERKKRGFSTTHKDLWLGRVRMFLDEKGVKSC